MLVHFNEKTNRIEYAEWAIREVPEFYELINRLGRESFEVVALLEDYQSPYRYLQKGKERNTKVISDWKKRTDTRMSLSQEKLDSQLFVLAREAYVEHNYDPIWDEYNTLEQGKREDLKTYRGYYDTKKTKKAKNLDGTEKEIEVDKDPKERATIMDNIKKAQQRMDELIPLLFDKPNSNNNQRRNLRTIKEKKE